jgi:hypothetical protein
LAGTHARNHPAILIPAVCRAIEAEHLPVFKRQGKLHTGPARPHPLALDAVLAERPGKMVAWIRENTPAKLEGLWQAVLPEGSTAPPAEYAADLFWLLHQGHILLYTNDLLVVQDAREPAAANPEAGAKKKKKKKSKKSPTAVVPGEAVSEVTEANPASETASEVTESSTETPETASSPEAPATEASAPVEPPAAETVPEDSSVPAAPPAEETVEKPVENELPSPQPDESPDEVKTPPVSPETPSEEEPKHDFTD